MLDAVPEGLEFGAPEYRLARTYRATFVGVLDLQASGKLAKHLGDLCLLCCEFLGYDERIVLEGPPERILYPSLRIDVAFRFQMLPNGPRRLRAE